MIVPRSPMSWQRKVNDVTTPKLPPPPRRAQNRSVCEDSDRVHERAVREHDVRAEQVVDGEAEPPGQVADAAAERQPRDAGGADDAGRRRHAERDRGVVDVAPGAAGVGAHGVVHRVDRGAAQPRQVDDQRAVGDTQAARVVAAAAHGDVEAARAPVADAGDDVGGVVAVGDHRRPLVDHGVVDGARFVVAGVCRRDQVAAQGGGQFFVGCGGRGHGAPPRECVPDGT